MYYYLGVEQILESDYHHEIITEDELSCVLGTKDGKCPLLKIDPQLLNVIVEQQGGTFVGLKFTESNTTEVLKGVLTSAKFTDFSFERNLELLSKYTSFTKERQTPVRTFTIEI